MVGAIVFIGAAGPMNHLVVDCDRLPGRTACQDLYQSRIIVQGLDDLLNAHDSNVHRRQCRDHAPVAFIG